MQRLNHEDCRLPNQFNSLGRGLSHSHFGLRDLRVGAPPGQTWTTCELRRGHAPIAGWAPLKEEGTLSGTTDLLLVTVNEHETQAARDGFAKATGGPAKSVPQDGRIYWDLGTLNTTRVSLAISEMASAGPGGTQQTVDKAIRALRPRSVVALGIAFGMSEEKQGIGDVLISTQLRLYDHQRVGSKLIPRGDRAHASTTLINYFCGIAQMSWCVGSA